MPRVSLVHNLSVVSSEEYAERSITANKHSNYSKSKYEVFKDNYNKHNESKNEAHQAHVDNLKN